MTYSMENGFKVDSGIGHKKIVDFMAKRKERKNMSNLGATKASLVSDATSQIASSSVAPAQTTTMSSSGVMGAVARE